MSVRPNVLSIAGFDPSAGAGILADIKTFETHKVYGFGVCSALTFQNDLEFEKIEWIPVSKIIDQITVLEKRLSFNFIKIGIIENPDVLLEVVERLRNKKIIWDPILRATAGYVFHDHLQVDKLMAVLHGVFLVTPNKPESDFINSYLNITTTEGLRALIKEQHFASFYIKGGHAENQEAEDLLLDQNTITKIKKNRLSGFHKHGTGCVLSAAITANLAKGNDLRSSCKKAKDYIHQFIKSNHTNLGYHPA